MPIGIVIEYSTCGFVVFAVDIDLVRYVGRGIERMKKKIATLLAAALAFSAFGCAGSGGGESVEKTELPNYDAVQAEKMILNGWFAPEVSRESFQEYKDCGFNYMFLIGQNIGSLGGAKMFEAMDICEELDIKVFIDVTRADGAILNMADL